MYQQHQPAPRQRTAIACRYCRRRKIRCSGFEASEDGRCTNCVRFSQECIFTPVSAQTQAFVPAHTVWRGAGAPPPLYGAYGQPLPTTQPPPDSYRTPHPQPGYPLPSPTGPGGDSGGRSAADADMLNALNRRGITSTKELVLGWLRYTKGLAMKNDFRS
ncbi:putative c6 transcription protein [Neofusicoccum parvum UCRNP2]|uniref:Putative c6 transcription protein n=1 Tax=Botryosphaeria parva (strain UCR-NP2) TaxID=1287680 RepID=R1ESU5_BOTPV|nr:putative c6 transcription protein [Neofusicoccum parvum UCRNP2]